MICFPYDILFLECTHTYIDIYYCIIPPRHLLVSRASNAMVVDAGAGAGAGAGVGIDIDIGIHAVREQPNRRWDRRRAAFVTNR